MEDNLFIKDFAKRLNSLRMSKNISARDMSLSIGQSHNFINNIEMGKNFPTMLNFFYICEFLEISPMDFFDYENMNTLGMNDLNLKLKKLDKDEFENISSIVTNLCKNKND